MPSFNGHMDPQELCQMQSYQNRTMMAPKSVLPTPLLALDLATGKMRGVVQCFGSLNITYLGIRDWCRDPNKIVKIPKFHG